MNTTKQYRMQFYAISMNRISNFDYKEFQKQKNKKNNMRRDKSLKQVGLQQLIEEDCDLNCSSSESLLNQSLLNSLSVSFNSTKINYLNSDQSSGKINRYLSFQKQNTQKSEQSSLIKSKQIIQKFTNKISSLPIKKPQNFPIEYVKAQIYSTTKEINNQIDKRIQNTFSRLLTHQTIIPISNTTNKNIKVNIEKENFTPNAVSLTDGTKMLMTEYWEMEKKKPTIEKFKFKKNEENKLNQTASNLPKINQKAYSNLIKNQKTVLGKFINLEKKRQEQSKSKDQKLQMDFLSLKVNVIDYKIQNQTQQFLIFQKFNFKKWEDILFVLQCLEKLFSIYKISEAQINLKNVLELVQVGQKRQNIRYAFNLQKQPRSSVKMFQTISQNLSTRKQYSTHELLNCFENAEKISENHPHSKGIRYFGNQGKKRAILKIQSHFRRCLCQKKLAHMKQFLSKIVLIQRKYRSYLDYCKTKKRINEVQMNKIKKFNEIQENFRQYYRKNEITRKIKYEIHVCSMSSSEWQRVTTQNLSERQNCELARIFRIATKSTPLMETRVIYIAPNELPKEIVNYYKKIFEFGSENETQKALNSDKLSIIWPQNVDKLPETLTLTQKLLYSKVSMKRLKRIIKDNYCYIVPSMPSNDFITLSCQLNAPLYSLDPQKLLYLQTKAGSKEFAEVLKVSSDESFGVLPFSKDIYNKTSFINELAFLVCNYPSVRRWILKIDDQNNSRGLAYIDTSKIIKPELLLKLANPVNTIQKSLKQQIHQKLHESLIILKQERIIPVNKEVYRSQQEYMSHFLSHGGIIEASIKNFQSDLQNHCFTIQIEPDFQWKFITSYYKITNKNQTVGCYFDSLTSMQPPIQIQLLVKELINRKLFGFFTLEFLKIPNLKPTIQSSAQLESLTYFNGIQCHLNSFSSASFLKEFLSKDSNALYIPFLSHPSLKELRIQTFFHLCRLQNISFDIKRKIGNVFMFLNGLESGCMGLMSFNCQSKEETFQQVSDVLQFLGRKINQSRIQMKQVPRCFMSVRNVVNGYLKRLRDNKLSKQIHRSCSSTNIHRSQSNKEFI